MATDLEDLKASIEASADYAEVQAWITKITQRRAAADDPVVRRALRDAHVHALFWGVYMGYMEFIEEYSAAINAVEADAVNGDVCDRIAISYVSADLRDKGAVALSNVKFKGTFVDLTEAYPNYGCDVDRIKATLMACGIGSYISVWLHAERNDSSDGNFVVLLEQGTLKSIDEAAGNFVLERTLFQGQQDTFSIDEVCCIDNLPVPQGGAALGSYEPWAWKQASLGDWVRSNA